MDTVAVFPEEPQGISDLHGLRLVGAFFPFVGILFGYAVYDLVHDGVDFFTPFGDIGSLAGQRARIANAFFQVGIRSITEITDFTAFLVIFIIKLVIR